jgi:hypothetical protein
MAEPASPSRGGSSYNVRLDCHGDSSVTPVISGEDEEHLKLLAIFHYVVAAVGGLFACLPLIHVGLGIMMVMRPDL